MATKKVAIVAKSLREAIALMEEHGVKPRAALLVGSAEALEGHSSSTLSWVLMSPKATERADWCEVNAALHALYTSSAGPIAGLPLAGWFPGNPRSDSESSTAGG